MTNSPIISVKNQFAGINPIFNDLLQRSDKWRWEEFHQIHVVDLMLQIVTQLEGTAYTVHLEEGLQIRWQDDSKLDSMPKADVLVAHPEPTYRVAGLQLAGDFIAVPTRDLIVDIQHFNAIGIYRTQRTQGDYPVAWIELLSPTNKPGGRHALEYVEKRQRLLETGDLCFIELDYLNQSPPTVLRHFPDYTRREAGATPYRLLMSDTRHLQSYGQGGEKTLADSETYIAGFSVDHMIPNIPLTLPDLEPIPVNVQSAYNTTYERVRYGTRIPIEYQRLPETFEAYSPEDQQRMLRRLITINLAHQQGQSLDEAPLPINPEIVQPFIEKVMAARTQGQFALDLG